MKLKVFGCRTAPGLASLEKGVCVCVRERERDRQTDRQTDRQKTDRDRETERQRETETERDTHIQKRTKSYLSK